MPLRRRGRVLFAAYAGTVVLFVFAFHLRFHEPWRDETQALLIGRAITPGNLMETLRYESHPPLLHVLLKALDGIARAPWSLAVTAALNTAVLLHGAHALLRALARTERAAVAVTVALSATYFFTYELGVVARAYGLGLGLLLLMTARLQEALELARRGRRTLRPLVVASAAGCLAGLSSPLAAAFVAVALGIHGALFVAAYPRRAPEILVLAPNAGPVLLMREILRHDATRPIQYDHLRDPHRTLRVDWQQAKDWLETVFGGGAANGWWPVQLPKGAAELTILTLKAAVVALLVLHAARLVRRWRTALFVPLCAVLWTATFFYLMFYRGLRPEYRHFTFVMANVGVVMSGLCLHGGRPRGLLYRLRRGALVLLAPWFVTQAVVLEGNLADDARYPFSLTKRFAEGLPPEARVISTIDVLGTSIQYWRADVVSRSPNYGGRYFTFVRWDNGRDNLASMRKLAVEECGHGAPAAVYVFGDTRDIARSCVTPLHPPYDGKRSRTDEYANGWAVSCACVKR